MIPESFIQDLLARVDVVDVVGRYVSLRKGGINLLGLCPFHQEKTPSFTVSPSKQFYHCFGCGAHGTAIRFLMDHTGLSFPEAVRQLADSVGLRVPEEERSPAQRAAQAKKRAEMSRHSEVLEEAAIFYKQSLKHSSAAIQYLKSRGLTGEIAARFGLGWVGGDRTALAQVFSHYEDNLLVEAGLVVLADDGRRYDRFRDRIMFPIRNTRGHLIGFGGRLIAQGEPKYLNSPETPVFSKGAELYGLWESRQGIRLARQVIVVEGYMDVVMLAQAGVECAVATLGTSTTSMHLQKLLRVSDEIVFSFDGDKAGKKAAWRALEACLSWLRDDVSMRFLFLPEQHDPDSFVRAEGAERFLSLAKESLTLSQFLFQELSVQHDLQRAEGRARCIHEAKPLLQQIPKSMLRTQIVHELAMLVQLTVDELSQFLDLDSNANSNEVLSSNDVRVTHSERSFVSAEEMPSESVPAWHNEDQFEPVWEHTLPVVRSSQQGARKKIHAPRAPFRRKAVESLEQRLLRLLLTHPKLVGELDAEHQNLITSMPELRDVGQLITLVAQTGAVHSAAIIEASHSNPRLREALSDVMIAAMMEEELPNPREELSDAMRLFTLRFLNQHIHELVAQGLHSEESKLRYRELSTKVNELRILKGNPD